MPSTTAQKTVDPNRLVLRAVRFDGERDRVPKPWEGTVRDLIGTKHAVRESKKGTPAFSTVEYKKGASRGARGVLHATALVMDFDHLTRKQVELLVRKLQTRGWSFLTCTSWSHEAKGEDDQCFRLLLPVTRPILPTEYGTVWKAVNGVLASLADGNAKDISRIWFVASCPPDRARRAGIRVVKGCPVDVDGALAAAKAQDLDNRETTRAPSAILEGERNTRLTSVGGSLRRDGADRNALLKTLQATNRDRCRPPLEETEVETIVDSLMRYPAASPMSRFNMTDAGNAERFRQHVGQRFGYVHTWSDWLYFDGKVWRRDFDGAATRAAVETLRAGTAETLEMGESKQRDDLRKHLLRSESASRIGAMLSLAQAMLPVPTDRLDRDPDLLNVTNGTIDLRTGELRAHSREDWITRLAPVEYDSEATCPHWHAFVYRVMGDSEQLVAFIQRAVGYSLTGHTCEQILLLLLGCGANGKSTFLEILHFLLGDYYAITDFNTFMKRDSEGARNDLARLVGTRMVSAVEAEAGKALAEALVKQVTGGDTITARFLYREYFDFIPQFKIWLATNHTPTIRGSDNGIWRRIRLVPFTVTIPESERDPHLLQKLKEELPGILAWAVRGCLEWRKHGLGVPPEIQDATAAYREDMDRIGRFFNEMCVVEPGATVTSSELYEAYRVWAESSGEDIISRKALASELKQRGIEAYRTKRARCWRGLRPLSINEVMSELGDG